MRDDRRASHDPARGGVVGGGALEARRPAYKPSRDPGAVDGPVVTVTGTGCLCVLVFFVVLLVFDCFCCFLLVYIALVVCLFVCLPVVIL